MENISQSRRKFITTLALTCASLGLLWRYLTPPAIRRRTVVARVPKADVPVEGALVFSQERMALMREGDTVYALDLVCTHLGCTVTVTSSGLSCPCHGSRFDRQGRVLKGPADRPLSRLKVEERDGVVEVFDG
jgi:cytochrome b6-f complex iron-sulfur subunit